MGCAASVATKEPDEECSAAGEEAPHSPRTPLKEDVAAAEPRSPASPAWYVQRTDSAYALAQSTPVQEIYELGQVLGARARWAHDRDAASAF